MNDPFSIALSFRKFLTIPACPAGWQVFDLYLFRDEATAIYAGQSYCAFTRVWEHIHGGPHGHSIPGRFLLVNWPRSGAFTVELLSSRGPRFAAVEHNLDAAERRLIEELMPCLNVALNRQPAPLPPGYLTPNALTKHLHSYRRMLREAAYAAQREANLSEWD